MESLYSLLSPLVRPLSWLLETLHFTVGLSWGWAIVALTVIVRVAPTASDAVWVTSSITDDGTVASASLTYLTGSGAGSTTTVFTETMATTDAKPWTGSGAPLPWTAGVRRYGRHHRLSVAVALSIVHSVHPPACAS